MTAYLRLFSWRIIFLGLSLPLRDLRLSLSALGRRGLCIFANQTAHERLLDQLTHWRLSRHTGFALEV
jgi:hypothetical protein